MHPRQQETRGSVTVSASQIVNIHGCGVIGSRDKAVPEKTAQIIASVIITKTARPVESTCGLEMVTEPVSHDFAVDSAGTAVTGFTAFLQKIGGKTVISVNVSAVTPVDTGKVAGFGITGTAS